jgi:membrane-associated protease RseP (regulator of RpoE activity)
MKCTGIVVALALGCGAMVGWSDSASAQEQTAATCSAGEWLVGDLGLSGLECNCVYSISKEGERWWKFRSEPRVGSVRPGSPADGEIEAGDMITAIDGLLITTSEAGERFANISPGDEVTLAIRRGGDRVRLVALVAQAHCERLDITSVALQQPVVVLEPGVEVDVVPTVEAVPVPVVEVAPLLHIAVKIRFPEGWFGFGIRCNCEVYTEETEESPIWSFREPPEISLVEDGSPADIAGLQRGDLLLEIDGVDIMSEEGGRRFGAVKAGDTVTFKYRRGGRTGTVSITASERLMKGKPLKEPAELEALVEKIEVKQREQLALAEVLIGELKAGEIEKGLVEAEALQAEIALQQLAIGEELRESLVAVYQIEPTVIIGESPSTLRFTGSLGNVEVEVRGPREVVVVAEEDGILTIVSGETRILLRVAK